jgi:Tol biopolymer transport system component
MRHRALGVAVLAIGLALETGCGDNTGPATPPGLSVLASPLLTDTIGARPAQRLVVALVDGSGRPYPGVAVNFNAPAPEAYRYRMLVAPRDTRRWVLSATDTTDPQGHAEVAVWFGTIPGAASLEIDAPDAAAHLAVPFTVLAGAPARIAADPADSAAYPGGSYRIRTQAWDRVGNPVEGATYAAEGPVSVSTDGTVSALAIGRGQVVVRAMQVADTVRVSVVPRGTIAAAAHVADIYAIAMLELDGSGYRLVRTRSSTNPGSWGPTWTPDGTRLVYAGPYPDDNIYVVDLNGAEQLLVGDGPEGWRRDRWPEYTRDGSWVYFGVSQQVYSLEPSLWRVRADGSAPEQIASFATAFDYEPEGSPSPDGQHVIFGASGGMWNVDVDARTAVKLPSGGYTPRWSPAADLIAFVGPDFRSVRVSNPDGSQERVFAPEQNFALGLSWSPDGAWLIARAAGSLVLIRVADGLVLPLAYTGDRLLEPTWRP